MTAASPATQLKRTPLYDRHVALGGKIVPFAGYELPIQYTSIMEEHLAVRSGVGIFDVSHLGEIAVKGAGALVFLESVVPTDLSKLVDGRMQYTVVLNDAGFILDDIIIYRDSFDSFYLIVNASNIAKIDAHLQAQLRRSARSTDTTVADFSDHCGCIAIQGPKAVDVVDALFDKTAKKLGYYAFQELEGSGGKAWISRSGYTGEDGFEIFAGGETLGPIWDKLVGEGKRLGVVPCGLGARNTLRLEAGNGLYGHEYDETRTPYDGRLAWLVTNPKDYVGKQALAAKKAAGIAEKLVGFKVNDKAPARDGYAIFKSGKRVGKVASGSYSPSLKIGIGLAHVAADLAAIGTALEMEVHGRLVPIEVVKLPFVPIRHL